MRKIAILQFRDQPPLELYPESDTKFFMTAINAEVTFERTVVKNLSLVQDHKNTRAERIR